MLQRSQDRYNAVPTVGIQLDLTYRRAVQLISLGKIAFPIGTSSEGTRSMWRSLHRYSGGAVGCRFMALAVLAVNLFSSEAHARIWVDSTGKHRVEADFVELKDGIVQLRKPDGRALSVPLNRLSAADQQFIRQTSLKPASKNDPFKVKAAYEYEDFLKQVLFSPDGSLFAAVTFSTEKAIVFRDALSGETRGVVDIKGGVRYAGYSPDSKLLAVSLATGPAVGLLDAKTGEVLARMAGHEFSINRVAFSPDGNLIASGGDDEVVRIWKVSSRKEEMSLENAGRVWGLAFTPDSKVLAAGSGDAIKLWDMTGGKQLAEFEHESADVLCVDFSPDGKTLAAGRDGTIDIWDVTSRKLSATLQGHTKLVYGVAFSPKDKLLASGSLDGSVKVWDLATHKETQTLSGHATVQSVAFSPDGEIIASAGSDQKVILWSR